MRMPGVNVKQVIFASELVFTWKYDANMGTLGLNMQQTFSQKWMKQACYFRSNIKHNKLYNSSNSHMWENVSAREYLTESQ